MKVMCIFHSRFFNSLVEVTMGEGISAALKVGVGVLVSPPAFT